MLKTCPKCNRTIMDQMEQGMIRIRARLVMVPDSGEVIQALCPQCKQMIGLPLKIQLMPNDDC